MVNELLWILTAQTVDHLRVIASVAANELGQLRGTSAGFSGADRGPGAVRDPTLEDSSSESRPATRRQQVESH